MCTYVYVHTYIYVYIQGVPSIFSSLTYFPICDDTENVWDKNCTI